MTPGRALSLGVVAHGEPVSIRFGAKTIETMGGQTVLAALVAAWEMVCRTPAGGAKRARHILRNGRLPGLHPRHRWLPNQRACMTPVHAGMVVVPGEPAPSRRPPPRLEMVTLTPDVLVIGGGPAGLAAAAVAAEAGLDVVLIDERSKLGGQFYKQPADGFRD